MSEAQQTHIKLPERLTGSVELARVVRELKALDDWLHQSSLRAPGTAMKLPKTSATLEELATVNGVSLLDPGHRTALLQLLEAFSVHAPRVHMSFAVEPSGAFTQTMASWLRTNVSPIVLLEIGLQPTIAAGCMVRTTNKMFDMSLRHRFKENRHMLVESIKGVKPRG